jgi:hypothetical protein
MSAMSSNDEVAVQPLRAARVLVVRSEPSTIVLHMTGECDELRFVLTVDELACLAARLTADVHLLTAGKEADRIPS